jgi:2',3'-cyclic-nucleotide 2'-phosphodiesterase (5'-nucleotidase family)
LAVLILISSLSCRTPRTAQSKTDDGKLEAVFIQVNDVYEIAPLGGGKTGGMARVASLKKQYLQQNPNTFLLMAGDFVSPSVYNSLKYNGERIRGKQMVESMNAAGMDIAVFGNHEFDITEAELQSRINESSFQWISSNTFHQKGESRQPFFKYSGADSTAFPKYSILNLLDADGTRARIGIIGITLPFNKAGYVSYDDPLQTAKDLYALLKDSCDAVIAVTHQLMEDDVILATELPNLSLIIGGHEHDSRFSKTGNVYITKAHANAKSAYVVKVQINKTDSSIIVHPELKWLNEQVQIDSAADLTVQKWVDIANENYSSLGFDAKKIVINSGDSLDGRETEIRSRSTNLSDLIVHSMAYACPEADVVIMNAGSIRVDDILYPPITQYDIIRSLPYGGSIVEVDIKGSLLLQVLETGIQNSGLGGYLHAYPVRMESANRAWMIDSIPIDPEKIYRVGLAEFLMTGMEVNLSYLNKDNPGIVKVYPPESANASSKSDLRLAIVRYLESRSH